MAFTPILWYPPWVFSFNSNQSLILDGATEAYSCVGLAPKAGDIDRIVLTNYAGAVTGTAPTYDWRIETATSTADLLHASGTLWSTNTNATLQPVNTTVHTITLTSPATVAAGDMVALAVRYSSGTIDASNYWSMSTASGHPLVPRNQRVFPMQAFYDGAAWTTSSLYQTFQCITPLYDDGTPLWLGFHRVNHNTTELSVGGDERATKVRFAMDVQADSFHVENRAISASEGDYLTFRLYDGSGTLMDSYQADYGELSLSNQASVNIPFPNGPVTLNAGEWYTIGMTGTGFSGGRTQSVTHGSALAQNLSYGEYGVSQFFDLLGATRTYVGTWTGWSDTPSNKLFAIGVRLSGINTGSVILPRRGGLVTRL